MGCACELPLEASIMATERSPTERTREAELFGQSVTFASSETWIAYSVLLLRITMGWVFLQAGLDKYTGNGLEGIQEEPLTGGFSAGGYLNNALHPDNPAQDLFAEM